MAKDALSGLTLDLLTLPREALRQYFFGCRQLLDAAIMGGGRTDPAAAKLCEQFTAALGREDWREAWHAWRLLNVSAA